MKTIVFFIMLLLVGSKVTNKAESFSYNKEIILSVSDNIDRDIKGRLHNPVLKKDQFPVGAFINMFMPILVIM